MRPIRVLVVDDTVVVRRLVSQVLDEAADIEVVGTASNGRIALQQIPLVRPDVVTLDIEMPVLDGLATLAELRPLWPDLPVIMFSTLTERAAEATLEALSLGASDYVTKPSQSGDRAEALDAVRNALLPLVRYWGRARQRRTEPNAAPAPTESSAAARFLRRNADEVTGAIAIGISTGGPSALARLIPELPASLPVPVFVVQHMPPVFTRLLAERLDAKSRIRVVEAEDGATVAPGTVYVATGGRHLVLEQRATSIGLRLDDGPPENFCRPAVDVTLRSAVSVYGKSLLAVILTGMGSDGMLGARAVRAAGGRVLAQDEATSVVWGMPGRVVRDGAANAVLPLDQVAGEIIAATSSTRTHERVGAR
jgi:two-component system chemotaxis response regulator CheB